MTQTFAGMTKDAGVAGGTEEDAGWKPAVREKARCDVGKEVNAGQEIRGKVLRAGELVGYQAGSVVSREIMRQSGGGVTVFAFDQGQGLSEHTAPFDALVQVVEGEAEVVLSGRGQRVKAGEMIIMPANEPHALKAVERFVMILTMVKKGIREEERL